MNTYQRLCTDYQALRQSSITTSQCKLWQKTFCRIEFPIIAGAGSVLVMYYLSPPLDHIRDVIINDLGRTMLNYLSDTLKGQAFALSLGYKNVTSIALNDFMRLYGGVAPYSSFSSSLCYIFPSWTQFTVHTYDNILLSVGWKSVCSSGVATFIYDVIIKASPKLPKENHRLADQLLLQTDYYLEITSDPEEIETLNRNQGSLRCFKNRKWIVLGLGSAIFIADLCIKYYLFLTAQNQLNSMVNPRSLYQPGLPDFCDNSSICNATLSKQLPFNVTSCKYPAEYITYAQEHSIFNQMIDLGIGKIWTVAMLPLTMRVINYVPTIFRKIKNAFAHGCRQRPDNFS